MFLGGVEIVDKWFFSGKMDVSLDVSCELLKNSNKFIGIDEKMINFYCKGVFCVKFSLNG